MIMKRICVFCGSSAGRGSVYIEATRELGREMHRRGLGLVFGAGHIGLMGILADSILEAGGEAIGVIPRVLVDRELAHTGLTELRIVNSMHERKALMADLADAFIALPGGFGTADEFFEMLTWTQLKLQAKPIGFLNVNGFFDPLLAWLDRAVDEEFIKPKHRQIVRLATTASDILSALESHR